MLHGRSTPNAKVGPGSPILDNMSNPVVIPEPVSVDEIKSLLRVTGKYDDAFIATLIVRARRMAERITGRAIVKQSLIAWWDQIPGDQREWWDGVRDGAIGYDRQGYVEIPRPPLISVAAVKAYQNDDSAITMDPTQYQVDAVDPDIQGRVCLRLGSTWPVFIRPALGFSVEFIAGYTVVPEEIKHAILLMASWLYKNRGDCTDGGCAGGSGAMSFLSLFKLVKLV